MEEKHNYKKDVGKYVTATRWQTPLQGMYAQSGTYYIIDGGEGFLIGVNETGGYPYNQTMVHAGEFHIGEPQADPERYTNMVKLFTEKASKTDNIFYLEYYSRLRMIKAVPPAQPISRIHFQMRNPESHFVTYWP